MKFKKIYLAFIKCARLFEKPFFISYVKSNANRIDY